MRQSGTWRRYRNRSRLKDTRWVERSKGWDIGDCGINKRLEGGWMIAHPRFNHAEGLELVAFSSGKPSKKNVLLVNSRVITIKQGV